MKGEWKNVWYSYSMLGTATKALLIGYLFGMCRYGNSIVMFSNAYSDDLLVCMSSAAVQFKV